MVSENRPLSMHNSYTLMNGQNNSYYTSNVLWPVHPKTRTTNNSMSTDDGSNVMLSKVFYASTQMLYQIIQSIWTMWTLNTKRIIDNPKKKIGKKNTDRLHCVHKFIFINLHFQFFNQLPFLSTNYDYEMLLEMISISHFQYTYMCVRVDIYRPNISSFFTLFFFNEKNNKIPCGKRNFREKKVEILKPFHHPFMYGWSNLFHYTLIWFALCNYVTDHLIIGHR